MIITAAPCRINGLRIMEVSLRTLPDHSATLTAAYATLEQEHEKGPVLTHGKCTATDPHIWSKTTIDLLTSLIESMEEDLLPQHFKGVGRENENDSKSGPSDSGHEEADQV